MPYKARWPPTYGNEPREKIIIVHTDHNKYLMTLVGWKIIFRPMCHVKSHSMVTAFLRNVSTTKCASWILCETEYVTLIPGIVRAGDTNFISMENYPNNDSFFNSHYNNWQSMLRLCVFWLTDDAFYVVMFAVTIWSLWCSCCRHFIDWHRNKNRCK